MRLLALVISCAGLMAAADQKLGKPLALTAPTPIATLLANPAAYTGKTVQIRGKITEVCEMMGCWMDLADEQNQKLRIKVNDGEIVFPKESAGKVAVAEGVFTKIELTKEQAIARAKEEAEENHRKFNPDSVKGPVTIYQLQGSGAVIAD